MKKNLQLLADDWHNCQRCVLHNERTGPNIVFGLGSADAKYMLLYDAPSEGDAERGKPMTGDEGNLLVDLLEKAGVSPAEVYCTPLVGCRPTTYLPPTPDSDARYLDRAPAKEELDACSSRVHELIYRIDPRIIFTMGDAAWKSMVKPKDRGMTKTLDKAIGDLFVTRVPGRRVEEIIYDVIPMMSMKQIIAQPSFAPHGPLASTIKHLQKGLSYARFTQRANHRDCKASGFAPEAEDGGGSAERDGRGARAI